MKFHTILLILSYFLLTKFIVAKEIWVLDKDLSAISFELPVFLMPNVKGEFKEIEGLVEIDLDKNKNNKAVFSVNINSIEMNYDKYKELLLSKTFFYESKYPIALIDTYKFSYKKENMTELMVELNIKGLTNNVPLELEIIHLAENLVQIKGNLNFSRTSYNIGSGKWSSTTILKDNIKIITNLFLFKN